MQNNLYFTKGSESRFSLFSDNPAIIRTLDKQFSGRPPNIQFHPMVKRRLWDGVIHHIRSSDGTAPIGLFPTICRFAMAQPSWNVHIDETIWPMKQQYTQQQVRDAFAQMNLPPHITHIDDYQIESVWRAVNNEKILIESPTSSGKSLIIYAILRILNVKSLIIVPTIPLVDQMVGDMISYGCDPNLIASITAGEDKLPPNQFVVSTWQSLYGRSTELYKPYQCFIGDEAHESDTKSLHQISNDLVNARYRIGTTGTLPQDPLTRQSITGIFGPRFKTVSTKELIDRGRATKANIKVHLLKHQQKLNNGKRLEFADEIDFLINSKPRNQYIVDLVVPDLQQSKNVVVFCRYHEHMNNLQQMLIDAGVDPERIFIINRLTKRSTRNQIQKYAETATGICLIVTFRTFSTGVNIRNLHSLVYAHPIQKRDKVIQSIGRMIRLHQSKDSVDIHDIADLLYRAKETVNHGFTHAMARTSYYTAEGHPWSIIEVVLDYPKEGRSQRSVNTDAF